MQLQILLLLLCAISTSLLNAQHCYWQQRVDYNIAINFDHTRHRFDGDQSIKYTNNSPDTLSRLFVHLYFNAFQPGSMMDARSRSISDPDERITDRIAGLSVDEQGYHHIKQLEINGQKTTFSIDGTLMLIPLSQALLPGATCTLSMKYESQVPVQIRRSGRNNAEGVSYSMSQWYPKIAAYDRDGWAADAYVGREFHGEFGDFEVAITIDSAFTLGGTGVLQNPHEIGKGYKSDNGQTPKVREQRLTWRFKATQVHDFAWASDPHYRHDIQTLKNGTELHFFYKKDTAIAANWLRLQPLTAAFFELMNERFGNYPYPQFSVIQAGDGGMEYPMSTFISGTGTMGGLLSVTVHEAIHNWYYGVLATNESRYPWMDEGFTSFAQDVILDILYGRNSTNPHRRAYQSYLQTRREVTPEPLSTPADFYHTNRMYGVNSYHKGVVFLKQLEYIVGTDAFYKGIKQYFEEWKYKHPTPTDFRKVMEKSSGFMLTRYFDLFIGTNKSTDYAIDAVRAEKKHTVVVLKNNGQMPMPVELAILDKDSHLVLHYIPMDGMFGEKQFHPELDIKKHRPWPWTHTYYELRIPILKENIAAIAINPEGLVADTDADNDTMPMEKAIFKDE
jgi:hypothetical protein